MGEKTQSDMQSLWDSAMLDAGSAAWVESLYETFLRNPNEVESHWRNYFETLPRVNGSTVELPHDEVRERFRVLTQRKGTTRIAAKPDASRASLEHERKQVRVLQMINAYRFRGHQNANLDPLRRNHAEPIDELTLRFHQLGEADMDTVYGTGSLSFGKDEATLREIYNCVRAVYCGSIGAEYMHITETEEKRWIQKRLESSRGIATLNAEYKQTVMEQLTAAEGLERYLHTRYVGQKRFSLEGGESLIPLLQEIIRRAGEHGMKEVVMGMAHRGRLNVLINVMGKTPQELFQEFEGKKLSEEYAGDVKYHMGFSSDVMTTSGPVHLVLAFNPSHLEIVGPVVEGSVRARQDRRGDKSGDEVLPVQVHGDAAFAGQGVVVETLQMSQTRGYSTKGTVHVVVNNQIGFTTSYHQNNRSTYYCTDVAKTVNAPILHVNGDDPEAVIQVTRMALDYRATFKKDVVIDLVCYRRHGHNEADEPSATQPMMYTRIKNLPTTCELYAAKLHAEGVLDEQQTDDMATRYRDELDAGNCVVPNMLDSKDAHYAFHINWHPYENSTFDMKVDTRASLETIRRLSAQLEKMPDEFELHPRVAKIMADRHKMTAGALEFDWGYAEIMAYATLLDQGYPIRLSGQDSGRGTFFHRHAVWHNQLDGRAYVPLRNLSKKQASFLVIDSLLSEEAVLAFEYGYATAEPRTLVLWEAQFGDFANNAQVVIDQFISAGEQKWGRLCHLTMLLPHGFEGQGAEHSSARLERYLQLCAQNNIQVCMPSTPAQMFHLLRRQMIRPYRKPLIVMTPKSLLRHKLAVNSLSDLTDGEFSQVLGDPDQPDPQKVRRVIMCSGKVYYDLLQHRRQDEREDVALIRVEELYPFPSKQLNHELHRYPLAKKLIWCQEEPKNQGAWDYLEPRMAAKISHPCQVQYVGRSPSASPAVGSAILHARQQKTLIAEALG